MKYGVLLHKVQNYYNPSITPLLTTMGEFLNKCNPDVRNDIIDRCTTEVYKYFEQGNYQGIPPTLNDFRIEEILNKEKSSTILSNSELIIMLNQSATDREKLAKFLSISDM